MTETVLFNITVAFSIIAGTGAALLSLLTWEIFRHSPFGRVVFVLSLVMTIFIFYHVILISLPSEPIYAKLLKSLTYTLLVAFIGLMIHTHYRMRRSMEV